MYLKTIIIGFLIVGFCSCTNQESDKKIKQDHDEPQIITNTDDFESLHKKLISISSDITPEEKTKVIDALLNMAISEGRVEKDNADKSLMFLFPNDELGIALFHRISLAKANNNELAPFIQEVQEQATNTAIEGASLSATLDILAHENWEGFLARCQQIIGTSESSSRTFRVALYTKAHFLNQHGELKEAALDFMHFWALYPDRVDDLMFGKIVPPVLKDAGFYYEAYMLSSPRANEAAPYLWDYYAKMDFNKAESGDVTERSLQEQYYSLAPQHTTLLNELSGNTMASSLERIDLSARITFLARENRDYKAIGQSVEYFTKSIPQALIEAKNDVEQTRRISLCIEAVIDASSDVDSWLVPDKLVRSGLVEIDYETFILGVQESVLLLYTHYWALQKNHLANDTLTTDQFQHNVEQYLRMIEGFRMQNGILVGYDNFVDLFPESKFAPQCLYRKAEYCNSKMNAPLEATKTYQQLVDDYPNSEDAQQARLKLLLGLYTTEQFEEAYGHSQIILADEPDDQHTRSIALYISGLSLAGMGMDEEAQLAMETIVTQYPSSTKAVYALFWIGSNKLAQQEYSQALDIFTELVQKYPNDKLADRAKSYISKLSSLSQ